MLNQIVDTKLTSVTSTNNSSAIPSSVSNRRHPVNNTKEKNIFNLFLFFSSIKNTSNRISEHDNRNLIQNYGEYFGRVNTYLNSIKQNIHYLISSLRVLVNVSYQILRYTIMIGFFQMNPVLYIQIEV